MPTASGAVAVAFASVDAPVLALLLGGAAGGVADVDGAAGGVALAEGGVLAVGSGLAGTVLSVGGVTLVVGFGAALDVEANARAASAAAPNRIIRMEGLQLLP
jgi:hypothetical protein